MLIFSPKKQLYIPIYSYACAIFMQSALPAVTLGAQYLWGGQSPIIYASVRAQLVRQAWLRIINWPLGGLKITH